MTDTVFRRAMIFDGWSETLDGPVDLRVADKRVAEISTHPLNCPGNVREVHCNGRTLMPGLIDAHVHVNAASLNLAHAVRLPDSYLAHFAANFMSGALSRGFTTLRDVGGADVGLANALRDGLVQGPRLYFGGKIISQTGGHGDARPVELDMHEGCGCAAYSDAFATLADGADAVRKAVREELRRGASHIKIMASGGVTTPTDPLDRGQFSDAEITAAVDEATRAGKYVAAHCHPVEAIQRCVALGVRSIEHATLINRDAALAITEAGAFAVPTLAILFALHQEGHALGISPVKLARLAELNRSASEGLDIMASANVKMGFGTDLLGPLHTRQADEFRLRAEVLRPIEILRSACAINAELLGESGRLGCIAQGAYADLLVVDGDPLRDISILHGSPEKLKLVMKDGNILKMASD